VNRGQDSEVLSNPLSSVGEPRSILWLRFRLGPADEALIMLSLDHRKRLPAANTKAREARITLKPKQNHPVAESTGMRF
jgi:hypothetical protein